LVDCTIVDNQAISSGGIRCDRSDITIERCLIARHTVSAEGGGIHLYEDCICSITDCVIAFNTAGTAAGILLDDASSPMISGCTIYGNAETKHGGAITLRRFCHPWITRSIVVFNEGARAVYCEDPPYWVDVDCSDFYGNEGGDWIGCVEQDAGVDGNLSTPPLFCDPEGYEFTLRSDSPCLPGQHPDGASCGLIGAYDVGCAAPTSVERKSWGGIKRLFR